MDNQISTINELAQRLWKLQPIKPEYQDRINRKIRLEFNYNSNHIEGNTLTYGETKLLLIFGKTSGNHDIREYEEMKAHDVAFEMIQSMAADKERPLTESAIRQLHEVLLVQPYWRDAVTPTGQPTRKQILVGTYKTVPNHVQLSNGEVFYYATPEETPAMMKEMMEWYRREEEAGELHPLQLAALLHYRFVRIHPFDDGNGRLSRLLMNYALLRNNYPPVVIKSEDKKNYLFALNQADTGNLDAFVSYIGEQLIWSLELYIKGGHGESLEEVTDLNKEIELWQRQVALEEIKSLRRDDIAIYDLVVKGKIEELFEQFEESTSIFYNNFRNHNVLYYLNNNAHRNPKVLISILKEYSEFAENVVSSKKEYTDQTTSIRMIVALAEFKHSEKNPFSISKRISLDLQPYSYNLSIDGQRIYTKKYGEYLTAEERSFVVNSATKELFEGIKSQSAK